MLKEFADKLTGRGYKHPQFSKEELIEAKETSEFNKTAKQEEKDE